MTEDEMVGWHHQLSGHEFEQTHLLLLWIPTFFLSLTCMSLFYILHLMIPVSETLAIKLLSGCICSISVQFSSVAQSCLTLCDPMDHSMPGLPVHHQLQEFTQTHAH